MSILGGVDLVVGGPFIQDVWNRIFQYNHSGITLESRLRRCLIFRINVCDIVHYGFDHRFLFPFFYGEQTKSVLSAIALWMISCSFSCSSQWKYKSTACCFSLLMVYLIFASVKCSIQAAEQGGSANNVMLFSIVITYGCLSWSISSI